MPFIDGEVDGEGGAGNERDGGWLAALGQDPQNAVPSLESEVLDIGGAGFAHSQPIESE